MPQRHLFMVMIPFNYILRKWKGKYAFTKSQNNLNHLIYMEDGKLYTKNQTYRKHYTNRIFSQDVKMVSGIEKCTMIVINKLVKEMIDLVWFSFFI